MKLNCRITTTLLTLLTLGGSASALCQGRIAVHVKGTTCIPKDVKRIVALEWKYAENLLALGIQPVGVADIKGYNKWVDIGIPLASATTDVGRRQQPSLEEIRALKPDLIITEDLRAKQIYDQLQDIAPTLVYNSYGGNSEYLNMRKNFLSMAHAVNRREKANETLRTLDNTLTSLQADFRRKNRIGETFVATQAFTYKNNPSMRLFTPNSMVSGIVERLGLVNAWNGKSGGYGFTQVGLEQLAALDGTDNFLYITQSDDKVFAAPSIQPLWNKLSFVREEQAYALDERTWTFGGPLSAIKLAQQVHDNMLK